MGPHFGRHVADLTIKQCREDYKQANFYPPHHQKRLGSKTSEGDHAL